MEVLLQIIEDVFETRKILRHGVAERLMGIEHIGVDLFLIGGAVRPFAFEFLALRRGASVRMDIEDLIEPETGEKIPAALATMNDVKMTVSQLLQPQSHARHRSHEGRIHHGAVLQIDHELTVTAVDHFPGKLLEVAAVKEAAFAFDLYPNGIAVYPDLD